MTEPHDGPPRPNAEHPNPEHAYAPPPGPGQQGEQTYPQPGQPAAPRYGPPLAPMSPGQERTLGMVAHLVPAVLLPLSAGTLGFIASLVIYLIYKDRGPFVRQHAANSLNVQIITAILLLISIPLMFLLIGFITYPVIVVVATIIHVIGAVKANNGEWWMPPLTPTMVR